MPRYTRMVGWMVRTATLVLTVLVGGGPAIAVVCETICAPHAAVDNSGAQAAAHSEHHHPVVHEDAGTDGADADHVDHQQTDAAAGDSRWSAFSRDCCREFAPPRYSLAASRVDANLLPASHAALLSFGASLTASDLQSDEPIHGPPVGNLSPARVPLVLRI
jgi:hypothetical protein